MKQLDWLFRGASALGIVCTLAIPALADQCSYISKEQATKAIARLNLNDEVYFLCEPCGEEVAEYAQIGDLSMSTVNYQDYWQIEINGEGIDLAYVFVDSGIEDNLANLAMISDCPAEQVSPLLPLDITEQEKLRDYYDQS